MQEFQTHGQSGLFLLVLRASSERCSHIAAHRERWNEKWRRGSTFLSGDVNYLCSYCVLRNSVSWPYLAAREPARYVAGRLDMCPVRNSVDSLIKKKRKKDTMRTLYLVFILCMYRSSKKVHRIINLICLWETGLGIVGEDGD